MRKTTISLILTLALMFSIPAGASAASKPSKPKNARIHYIVRGETTAGDYISFKVSWKESKRAKKYEVKMQAYNGKKSKTRIIKKTTYNDKIILKNGRSGTLIIKIRAINGTKKSGWTTISKSYGTANGAY